MLLKLKSNKMLNIFSLFTLVLFSLLTLPEAKAVVSDSNVYSQYQAVRLRLMSKETSLLHDYDSIQKQIDDLSRRNGNDRSLNNQIDELSRNLDRTYEDLRKVRLDIRDVNLKLM